MYCARRLTGRYSRLPDNQFHGERHLWRWDILTVKHHNQHLDSGLGHQIARLANSGQRRLRYLGTLEVRISDDREVFRLLDMATSLVALGQIVRVRAQGKTIPVAWAVDEDGNPTTDPDKAKWLSPAAGPKGYALGAIVDVPTGMLMGGAFGPHVGLMYGDLDKKPKLRHLVGVLDPGEFPRSDNSYGE